MSILLVVDEWQWGSFTTRIRSHVAGNWLISGPVCSEPGLYQCPNSCTRYTDSPPREWGSWLRHSFNLASFTPDHARLPAWKHKTPGSQSWYISVSEYRDCTYLESKPQRLLHNKHQLGISQVSYINTSLYYWLYELANLLIMPGVS